MCLGAAGVGAASSDIFDRVDATAAGWTECLPEEGWRCGGNEAIDKFNVPTIAEKMMIWRRNRLILQSFGNIDISDAGAVTVPKSLQRARFPMLPQGLARSKSSVFPVRLAPIWPITG